MKKPAILFALLFFTSTSFSQIVQEWDQTVRYCWYYNNDETLERRCTSLNSREYEFSDTWKPMVIDTIIYKVLKQDWNEIEIEYQKRKPQTCLYYSAYRNGKDLASDYEKANCTELMTELLSKSYNLTPKQIKQINIALPNTNAAKILEDLKAGKEKPEYGGVCHFVEANGYGKRIYYWEDLLPGDVVQWWWFTGRQGHCGIIKHVNLKERWFEVFSSTPDQGFGVKRYAMDFDAHFFFARIENTEK